MKTIYLVIMAFIVTPLFSFNLTHNNNYNLVIQAPTTVEAKFDGREDYGYNFIGTHGDGEEFTLTFQKVADVVMAEFDLNSNALVGAKFKITYTTKITVTKDSDGYEDENEINTITKLEKL